jgi:hypothetical protein
MYYLVALLVFARKPITEITEFNNKSAYVDCAKACVSSEEQWTQTDLIPITPFNATILLSSFSHFFIICFRYSDLRLIDIPGIKASLPMTIEQLLQHVEQSCENSASILRDKWIPSCVKIISDRRDDVEAVMSENEVGLYCVTDKNIVILSWIAS